MIDEISGGTFHSHFHAAKAPHEKIGIEVLSAKLAVRDGLQPDCFLPGDDLSNSAVLDMLQLLRRDSSCGMVLPSAL
jgi:hypothetical protein